MLNFVRQNDNRNFHIFHPQVSDFGLAQPMESIHEGGKLPIKWTAPEALTDNASIYTILYKLHLITAKSYILSCSTCGWISYIEVLF